MADRQVQTLIVGAGPAGLAAATACQGHDALIIDAQPEPGGQIWRGGPDRAPDDQARATFSAFSQSGIPFQPQTRVVAQTGPQELLCETPTGTESIAYGQLILCPGAREHFLPFPGWTLPGIYGAGGLQALSKGGLTVAGKRIVLAGSDPLLVAVAVALKDKGADVLLIAEQAPFRRLAGFATHLIGKPAKRKQALAFRRKLGRTPLKTGRWIVRAEGSDCVASVTLNTGETIACDMVGCGFGLLPNLALARLFGCRESHGFVTVDAEQRTSIPTIFCAGETTGIGGVDKALAEGRVAGEAAVGATSSDSQARRDNESRFASTLDHTFALRAELRALPADDTLVCRCEDVRHGDLKSAVDWREAKLHTRCGMGPCQGAVCGGATAFLYGWSNTSVRPPVTPVRLADLATTHSPSSNKTNSPPSGDPS